MSLLEEHLPIIEVIDNNIEEIWPVLHGALQKSSFIAIDVEMSGLGDRKRLFFPEVDLRYQYMRELAHSHATMSLGISCYICQQVNGKTIQYSVHTFDLLVLCNGPYTVQADSLKFLRGHGFDFNKQVEQGLPYVQGNDVQTTGGDTRASANFLTNGHPRLPAKVATINTSGNGSSTEKDDNNGRRDKYSVRGIFTCLVAANKPIVFHNGLVDLIFLYQHFYAELPRSIETFAADISDMFPLGIYDTKYFSEFIHREPATYLQFVYVHELMENEKARHSSCQDDQHHQKSEGQRRHVRVCFPEYGGKDGGVPGTDLPRSVSGLRYYRHQRGLHSCESRDAKADICNSYAYHGWCDSGDNCHESHNMHRIVQELHKSSSQGGRKRTDRNRKVCFSAPKSTGTNAILQSALLHNARHRQLNKKQRISDMSSDSSNFNACEIKNEGDISKIGANCSSVSNPGKDEVVVIPSSIASTAANNECGVHFNSVKAPFNNDSDCSNGRNGTHSDSGRIENSDVHIFKVITSKRSSVDSTSASSPSGLSSVCNEMFIGNLQSSVEESSKVSKEDRLKPEGMDTEDRTTSSLRHDSNSDRTISNTSSSEGHTAGFDAFMTGFIFAAYVSRGAGLKDASEMFTPEALGLEENVNKVYLMGKDIPFLE